jgi:hypothetical protein
MDANIVELWRSVGLIAKAVALTLTVMTAYLVVASIQARRRWQTLVEEVGRVESLAESADKAPAGLGWSFCRGRSANLTLRTMLALE